LETARILTQKNIIFEYERLVNCNSRYYFPDFSLGEVVIECTFWDDVDQKAKELSEKVENYRKLKVETIVVTTSRYIERYSNLLAHLNVIVITSDKLTEVLDGKMGRVKRA
jgi:predicted nuclease of restriction endonuclease-like RecB superfamily